MYQKILKLSAFLSQTFPNLFKSIEIKNLERFEIFNLKNRKLILINDAGELLSNLDTVKAFVGKDLLEAR